MLSRTLRPGLVLGDFNGANDILVRDTCLGAPAGCTPSTVRVSVTPAGNDANGNSPFLSLSPDGGFAGFQSAASNLVASDNNNVDDVFLTATGSPSMPCEGTK